MAEYIEYDWGLRRGMHCEDAPRRKSENDRARALDTLRELAGASRDLALRDKSRCLDDAFLQRFLYARKHDAHEAFRLLVQYHAYRQRHGELWAAPDAAVRRALADALPAALEARDRRGRRVLVMLAAQWCPAACPPLAVYRALLLALEAALEDVQNQANGFVIVVDWSEFTFRQSCHLHPKFLKLIIEGLQDCLPVRFKGIHFIGQPWYVETALAVVKPFLRGKTRERIHLHGNNLSTLHEHLPRDILPPELGGDGPAPAAAPCLAPAASAAPAAPPARPAPPPADEPPRAKLDRGYIRANTTSARAELLGDREDHPLQ